jgi:protein-L-isoaspartate(D-aspartate) O-methyltransferase
MSAGFIIAEDQPMVLHAMSLDIMLAQLVSQVDWGELDYLIVDLPPGTADTQQSLMRRLGFSGAVVVVTPQDVAHLDARKALRMFDRAGVPLLGAVENMSGIICPHCGESLEVFSRVPHERSIWAGGVERLATIPLYAGVSSAGDTGRPVVVAEPGSPVAAAFRSLAASVASKVNGNHSSEGAEAARLRAELVERLRQSGAIRTNRVATAFETVPRHLFVPGHPLARAYSDDAIITRDRKGIPTSSSSQPGIMALMLEQLDVRAGQKVLEIGAGTGYNAALLSHLVGEGGRVVTIDFQEDVAAAARDHLAAAGAGNVEVIAGDGGAGHAAGAPYDRIIATAACWQIPPAWVDQLAEGGRLVLPLHVNGGELSMALTRHGDELEGADLVGCGFMPMQGEFKAAESEPVSRLAGILDDRHRVEFVWPDEGRADPLREYYPSITYVSLQGLEILRPLGFIVFSLSERSAVGFVPGHMRADDDRQATVFGTGEALETLSDALRRWEEEGRPGIRHLRVRVRAARKDLGPLPRPAGDVYRFTRGEHEFEFWFQKVT